MNILSKLFTLQGLLILGALVLMGSGLLGWIDQPIVGWLKGNGIRLSEDLPAVISYGSVCFSMGLLSLVALFKRARWVSLVTGAVTLWVALHFVLAFSLFHSRELAAINDLNREAEQISSFGKYMPPNRGVEPTFDESVKVDTIRDRLYATLHFVTLGWYASILGGLLLLVASMESIARRGLRRIALLLFMSGLVSYALLSAFPYLAAEHHQNKGYHYMAHGLYWSAIEEYTLARKLDRNLNHIKEFHIELGRALFLMGKNDEAEYYIYKAFTCKEQNDFSNALFYLSRVNCNEVSVPADVRNSLISWTYVTYGLSEYRMGIPSSAIDLWRKAVEVDPLQIQPYYFMSRAYHDIGSYQESIMTGLQFLKDSRDEIMRANASSNIADSYYRLQTYGAAREYYLKSILLDNYENLRAIMDLTGK